MIENPAAVYISNLVARPINVDQRRRAMVTTCVTMRRLGHSNEEIREVLSALGLVGPDRRL